MGTSTVLTTNYLELVSQLHLLSQDAVDAVVHRLKLPALPPAVVPTILVVIAVAVVVAPVVEPVHGRPVAKGCWVLGARNIRR